MFRSSKRAKQNEFYDWISPAKLINSRLRACVLDLGCLMFREQDLEFRDSNPTTSNSANRKTLNTLKPLMCKACRFYVLGGLRVQGLRFTV